MEDAVTQLDQRDSQEVDRRYIRQPGHDNLAGKAMFGQALIASSYVNEIFEAIQLLSYQPSSKRPFEGPVCPSQLHAEIIPHAGQLHRGKALTSITIWVSSSMTCPTSSLSADRYRTRLHGG